MDNKAGVCLVLYGTEKTLTADGKIRLFEECLSRKCAQFGNSAAKFPDSPLLAKSQVWRGIKISATVDVKMHFIGPG